MNSEHSVTSQSDGGSHDAMAAPPCMSRIHEIFFILWYPNFVQALLQETFEQGRLTLRFRRPHQEHAFCAWFAQRLALVRCSAMWSSMCATTGMSSAALTDSILAKCSQEWRCRPPGNAFLVGFLALTVFCLGPSAG